ncbi:MAG: YfhO family protein [Bacteroidetes bacterium]|nr:YfhO family protein [Bacteroidota bacterium]
MKDKIRTFLKRSVPHLIAILVFLAVAILYCKPAFDNKVLYQEDVLQWQGMSHNSFKYKETHGHFPLWTNSMFSGMPAYQIAMDLQSISIPGFFYGLLTLYLIKPASFFFLACICFYFLAMSLRLRPWIGIIGALAYAYATYNPVIVSVGHDTKMQAIALMPAIIASLILICEKKYWLGMVLTALFTSLIIQTNHMQIVYYTMIIAGGLLLSYAIRWVRTGHSRLLLQTLAMTMGAALIGVLCNAIVLLTTYDSSKETVRGGSELADTNSSYTHNGLSEATAFDFSFYKLEPFVMLVPDIYGGSTDIPVLSPERSKAAQLLQKMPPELAGQVGEDGPRYYWGGVGDLLSGPPYVGAIIVLLALLGFFILDGKHKWWILGVMTLTIVMSWGGHFQAFNSLLLKWLPMYNKFRAPSMILVVPTFLLCMIASMTLQKIAMAEDRTALWHSYKRGMLTVAGVFAVLAFLYFRFDYVANWDATMLKKAAAMGTEAVGQMQTFIQALRSDRQLLFGLSLLRSLVLVLAAAALIAFYIRKRLKPVVLVAVVGVLAFLDIMSLDLKYLSNENYQEKGDYQQNFAGTNADQQILNDHSYFRVFDLRDTISEALTYGAMTAYFHHSIGGYHAAKLKIYEDLINRQLFNFPNCPGVIDMLNTKYIIKRAPGGGDSIIENKSSLGPAWFVRTVQFQPTPIAVMNTLSHLHPKDTAVVFSADSSQVAYNPTDTTFDSIELTKNDNDEIFYLSQTAGPRFAVFSEVFYKRGWRAWIDDKQVPIIRTNYALRGLSIPEGRHIIRFIFRPTSYYLGRQLQWMASIIFLLMVAGAVIVGIHGPSSYIHGKNESRDSARDPRIRHYRGENEVVH